MQQSIHFPRKLVSPDFGGGGAVNWEWKGNYISSYHILSIALPLVWSLGPHTQKDYLNHFSKTVLSKMPNDLLLGEPEGTWNLIPFTSTHQQQC